MLVGSLFLAMMGAIVKLLSAHLSSVEIVFFRNVIGVFIISYSLYRIKPVQKGGKFWLLAFRGMIGFLALLMYFYNIAHIDYAEAITFTKTSPVFTAFFAYLFLKERLSWIGWVAIGIGFVGIVLITGVSTESITKTDLLGVLSGVGAALAYTSIRELKNYYDVKTIALSFMLTGTLGALLLMLLSLYVENDQWDFLFAPFTMPTLKEWILIFFMGIFATIGQIYLTKAYSVTKAAIVATISYSSILFALVIGLLLGDGFPSAAVISGAVLIVISGVLVSKK